MASKGSKGAAQSAWRSCKKFRLVVGRKKSCYPLLICSFCQALASCCHQNVTLMIFHAQHNAQKKMKTRKQQDLKKTRYVVSSGVYLLIVGMKCIVHLGLQRQTVNAANESCGQTLPTILVFIISLFCFLHRRSNQIVWSSTIVFPPSWLPLMPCQPQSRSAFERVQQSRWILSGSLASSTMPSQRQRCGTFSKNLNSFA